MSNSIVTVDNELLAIVLNNLSRAAYNYSTRVATLTSRLEDDAAALANKRIPLGSSAQLLTEMSVCHAELRAFHDHATVALATNGVSDEAAQELIDAALDVDRRAYFVGGEA